MILATRTVLYRMAGDRPEDLYQNGRIRAIAESGDTIAIVSNDGLALFYDGSERHQPLHDVDRVEALDILEDRRILIGTEGPHILEVTSETPTALESFDDLDCRNDFYTPWGGPAAVRSLAHTGDGWIFADIHVGSIMRSPDGGGSWEPVTPELHEDVHQVVVRDGHPDTVYANTADAVYVSNDRGDSWSHRTEGLAYSYGRAIAVHPDDGDCLIATVSRGPHGDADGRLYRSDDCGRSWTHVTNGFPDSSSQNIDTFQIAFSSDGRAWAAIDRDLYVSEDRAHSWKVHWTAPDPIKRIAT